MSEEKLTPKFDIPVDKIEEMIGMRINGFMGGYRRVVSPKDLKEIRGMNFFREEVFTALIRRIPLRDTSDGIIYPYADSRIQVFGREPKGLDIGQTFILKDKLISLMSGLENVFREFVCQGISYMPPAQLYGIDREGNKALAFYVPPIVEIHGNHAVLIDGIHRSYICSSVGTTINAVHISYIDNQTVLPFAPITWQDTKIVDEKPPIEERYHDLRKAYFRELSAIGIDG